MSVWKCAGCVAPSTGRMRVCDCPTSCLYREGSKGVIEKAVKVEPPALPRPVGVSRVADNDCVVSVAFNRRPTDDELRFLHGHLKAAHDQEA